MSVRNAYASGRGLWRFCCLMLALILISLSPAAALADLNCVSIRIADRPSSEIINTLQQQLTEMGYYTGNNDRLWGPLTRDALREFCTRETFARNDDLQLMVDSHAIIYKAYPDWKATLASKDFQQWMKGQPDHQDIGQILKSGDASSVIAVLKRFNEPVPVPEKKPAPEMKLIPEPKPVARVPDDVPELVAENQGSGQDYVSYGLTKDDLAQLKLEEKVSDLILQLVSKAYADQDTFEAEAKKVLKDVPDADEIIDGLERYGVRKVNYRLGKESFEALKVKKVPDYILKALEKLKDLNYPAGEFDQNVTSELSAMTARLMGLRTEVVTFAEISPSGARISEDSLARIVEAYPDDSLVAAVAGRLAGRKDITYQSDKSLAWAVRLTLGAMAKQVEEAGPLVRVEAVRVQEYVIDKEGAAKIAGREKEPMIPGIYLELISELEGVDYPSEDLFWYAVKSRVEFATPDNFVMRFTSEPIWRLNARKVDDELLAEWKKENLPPAILEELSELEGVGFDSPQALEDAIAKMLRQLADTVEGYEQFRQRIVVQARKRHSVKSYAPIQWKGSENGCVSENLSGETYGLYSYWMAGEQHEIDFSVHRRVGYFGVFLDSTGDITESRHWGQEEEFQSFARVAHTYCSKADLVVYRDTWSEWKQTGLATRQMFFKRAAENIARLVAQPMTDSLSRIESYLSPGRGPEPVMGDGVTLYFPGYPQDKESITEFVEFIRLLHDQLLTHGRKYSLNIMFRSTDIGKGVYEYSRLLTLMRDIERESRIKALLLVLLREPTTLDKKELRRNIENSIHGEERRELLRHVAMVISFDGKNVEQLQDDVIYANDNFGGIGFWTQPFLPEAAPISDVLRKFYQTDDAGTVIGMCKIICPDRWMFRLAWGIFGLLLLASLPLYMLICDWRAFFKKYFMFFIAAGVIPFVLLTAALLSCDPAWVSIARGNTLLLVTIVGILVYSIWKYRAVKKQANLP